MQKSKTLVIALTYFLFMSSFAMAQRRGERSANVDSTVKQREAKPSIDLSYEKAVKLADLKKKDIVESSGLAVSWRAAKRYWTHNDSGDDPRLFAFDHQGKHLGTSKVKGAKNVDWEDMSSALINGVPLLFIGDIGDNLKRRDSLTIYVCQEPKNPKKDMKVSRKIDFQLSAGPLDCEALAFDPVNKEFLIIEKRRISNRVFSLPLNAGKAGGKLPVAKEVGVIEFVPMITAADISYDGKYLVVTNLLQSFVFQRKNRSTWAESLVDPISLTIAMPWRKQGETICFGRDGVSLYATSEKKPTPLIEIRSAAKIK